MKSSKKLLSVILSAVMLMSAVSVGFVSGAEAGCDHNIGAEFENSTMVMYSNVPATCLEKGVENYECTKCLHIESVAVPVDPDNHAYFGAWQTVDGKAADCVTDGEKIRYCDCGYSETGVIPATGEHTFADEAVLDFWWTAKDADVGTVYEGWTIVELPTCISTGLARTNCTECGTAEKTAELHMHSKNFVEADRKDATCVSTGECYVLCSECNHNLTLVIPVDESKHALKWKVTTEPTCTDSGVETAYCQWHGELENPETREVPAKPHSFTNYIYDKNATCTKDGTKTAKCDYGCGEEDTVNAEGTQNHCFTKWYFYDEKNNCSTGGKAYLDCTFKNCDVVYTEVKTFAPGEHPNMFTVTVEATCTEGGYKQDMCPDCGFSAVISGTETQATGHSMKWVTKDAPSCISEKNGTDIGTCTKCGYSETKTVDYKHYLVELTPQIEATCAKDGSTARTKCLACYKEFESEVIPAFGHNDINGDGCCDICYEWFVNTPDGESTSCRCLCHNPDGIAGLFYKIYLFFIKLLGIAQECDCGILHYEKTGLFG